METGESPWKSDAPEEEYGEHDVWEERREVDHIAGRLDALHADLERRGT